MIMNSSEVKENVFIALITSNNDGNVVVTTKPFYTSRKAEEYLMQQYKEIKGTEEFFVDNLREEGKDEYDRCTDFHIETEDMYYWCSGEVQKMEIE